MGKITDTQIVGTVLQITVRGRRLDAASARDFKLECEAAWQAGVAGVEIDLGAVEFVDSSGIGALLSVYKKLPVQAAGVKLRRVKPAVQSVIELLRLHRIFEIQA
jgi:anti-sigma B factor antagonist